MSTSAEKVLRLREVLAERFGLSAPPKCETLETGLSSLDSLDIPRGALTEIVAPSADHRQGGGNHVVTSITGLTR